MKHNNTLLMKRELDLYVMHDIVLSTLFLLNTKMWYYFVRRV